MESIQNESRQLKETIMALNTRFTTMEKDISTSKAAEKEPSQSPAPSMNPQQIITSIIQAIIPTITSIVNAQTTLITEDIDKTFHKLYQKMDESPKTELFNESPVSTQLALTQPPTPHVVSATTPNPLKRKKNPTSPEIPESDLSPEPIQNVAPLQDADMNITDNLKENLPL